MKFKNLDNITQVNDISDLFDIRKTLRLDTGEVILIPNSVILGTTLAFHQMLSETGDETANTISEFVSSLPATSEHIVLDITNVAGDAVKISNYAHLEGIGNNVGDPDSLVGLKVNGDILYHSNGLPVLITPWDNNLYNYTALDFVLNGLITDYYARNLINLISVNNPDKWLDVIRAVEEVIAANSIEVVLHKLLSAHEGLLKISTKVVVPIPASEIPTFTHVQQSQPVVEGDGVKEETKVDTRSHSEKYVCEQVGFHLEKDDGKSSEVVIETPVKLDTKPDGLVNANKCFSVSVPIDLLVDLGDEIVECTMSKQLRAPARDSFADNCTLPEVSGRILIAMTKDGLKEIFLREETIMRYEDHNIEPYILSHGEGTVDILMDEDKSYPDKEFSVKTEGLTLSNMELVGDIDTVAACSRKLTNGDFAKAITERPLFLLDENEDEGLIVLLENRKVVNWPDAITAMLEDLYFAKDICNINPLVGTRVRDIIESRINRLLAEFGVREPLVNILDNLSTLKTLVGETGKAKLFFMRMSKLLESMSFNFIRNDDGASLWYTETFHMIDGEIEFTGKCGVVNPHLNPDAYKMLSRALITVGGTGRSIITTTDNPSVLVEAYRLNQETGIGDAGIRISRIIKL